MYPHQTDPYLDRDLSWLAFNHRVLQEAADPSVPPFDRLGFLAIFSSNLDEFFRVRVAALRGQARGRASRKRRAADPAALLARIQALVVGHQEEFGRLLREEILPELRRQGIRLADEGSLTPAQRHDLGQVFRETIVSHLDPVVLEAGRTPFLRNRAIYLVVELYPTQRAEESLPRYGLVQIPSPRVPRFVALPEGDGTGTVIFLDDLVRLHLAELFPGYAVGASHAIKLSRDAELYLEEEPAPSVMEAVRSSLGKRETGVPSRFLFDAGAPAAMLDFLTAYFGLEAEDLIIGGRYHNLHELHSFPRFGRSDLAAEPLAPVPHPELDRAASVLDAVAERDRIVHFPYQSYEPVIRFVREAASDPGVEEIWVTLYRVAERSEVVRALIDAAVAGKRVTCFVEVQARFDEAANLEWAERLEAAGARTIYSMPGLKVHAKLLLVVRRSGAGREYLACLSTGNFNERTARVYVDHALLTARPEITRDVREVFAYLAGESASPEFHSLLVAPFTLRESLVRRIEQEMEQTEAGRPAGMVLKMNSLEDRDMVGVLCRASAAGVPIQLVIRGICCLAAGVPGTSETIRARSIVDRFLEHARIFLFHDRGRETLFLASADWMTRNLSRRIEVAFPILDDEIRAELLQMLDLQLADNRKARVLDAEQGNGYIDRHVEPAVRSQMEIYHLLKRRAERTPSSDIQPGAERPTTRAASVSEP